MRKYEKRYKVKYCLNGELFKTTNILGRYHTKLEALNASSLFIKLMVNNNKVYYKYNTLNIAIFKDYKLVSEQIIEL